MRLSNRKHTKKPITTDVPALIPPLLEEFSFLDTMSTSELFNEFVGVGLIGVLTFPGEPGARGEGKGGVDVVPEVEELLGGEATGGVRSFGGGGDAIGMAYGEGGGA